MTLKQVRDWHIGKGGKASAYRHMGVAGMHYAMADAIDERIKADEMAAQSARERVEMALREPNSAKAAQVASELGATHRAANPPAQAAQVDDIRLGAPAWPGQMEGSAPPEGWVSIGSTIAPPAQPTALEDAVREVIAYLQKGHRFDVEQADKLTAALQENAK